MLLGARLVKERSWCVIAKQPAPAPHLAHPKGCAALRIVLVTVPRVSRSCENFAGRLDLHLQPPVKNVAGMEGLEK